MSGIVSGAHAEASITGTEVHHLPLNGAPEFAGARVDDNGTTVVRIEDGAFALELGDLETALAYRNALHQAVAHFTVRQAHADATHTEGAEGGEQS